VGLKFFLEDCMLATRLGLLFGMICLVVSGAAFAEPVDPDLQQKADLYQVNLNANHRPGLGAVLTVEYADDARTTPACYHYQGDSTIWTGMYLGSQSIRYFVTQDPDAKAQIIDTVRYLHDAMLITQTPGYLSRFAGPDEPVFSCDKGPERIEGYGDWAGYYWYDETSRDQYSGWIWGMTWAYDVIDDEPTKETIRTDMRAVMDMLEANSWHITDQNGEWTGNGAHWIGPMKRVAWTVMAAHVLDEPHYWDLLDEVYATQKRLLWFDTWSFYNRYSGFGPTASGSKNFGSFGCPPTAPMLPGPTTPGLTRFTSPVAAGWASAMKPKWTRSRPIPR
jgi:hypothetical protein